MCGEEYGRERGLAGAVGACLTGVRIQSTIAGFVALFWLAEAEKG